MLATDFFAQNRKRLIKQFKPNSFIVLTAFTELQRTNDFAYPFEQESNFWYLTGINASDWRLIIDTDSGEAWLVAPQLSEVQELFDGGLTRDEAEQTTGIRQIVAKREGAALLRQLMAKKQHIYTLVPQSVRWYGFSPNPAQRNLIRQLDKAKIVDIRQLLAKQRAIKQPAEIEAIQQAINTTIAGIQAMAQELPKLTHEYQAEAAYTTACLRQGARQAWEPIFAAGKNACLIHYVANSSPLKTDQWLLFDVGVRQHGYVADIARTIPLGRPSQRQLEVHQAVLRVRDFATNLLRPGQNVREYLEAVDNCMIHELKQLGLLKRANQLRTFFPHAISHGLGIDPHDPLGRPEVFAENMILTVEPGIYSPEEELGIRIEDDILITADGPKNLSAALTDMVY